MKCDYCPAYCLITYPESYDEFWYCKVGIQDTDVEEFPNGKLGCRTPRNKIEKILKEEKTNAHF